MPRCPVIQPNGKVAIWSTVVDDFVAIDCDVMEMVEELTDSTYTHQPYSAYELGRCLLNLQQNGRAWKWAPTLDEAIETIRQLHWPELAVQRAAELGLNLPLEGT